MWKGYRLITTPSIDMIEQKTNKKIDFKSFLTPK